MRTLTWLTASSVFVSSLPACAEQNSRAKMVLFDADVPRDATTSDSPIPMDQGVPDAGTSRVLGACGAEEVIPPMPIGRYRIELLEKNFDPVRQPPRYAADFDCDGTIDSHSDPVTGAAALIDVDFSSGQERFNHTLVSGPGELNRIVDFSIIELERGGYPSIVLAEVDKANGWFAPLFQEALVNESGTLHVEPLGLVMAARAVDCAWWGTFEHPLCFFASYLGVSALAEVRPNQSAENLNREFGLPFPVPENGYGTDGHHMIGAAFLDYDSDGVEELVVVGQHSKVMLIDLDENGESQIEYHGPTGDYRRVWATRHNEAPCVYYAAEFGEWRSDFVECYDADAREWQHLELGEVPGAAANYVMVYKDVRFWDENSDGNVDFAASTMEGGWDLFTLIRED